jgi:hypothetical protein
VEALVRNEQPLAFTEFGVHDDVEVRYGWDGSSSCLQITFGTDGHTTVAAAGARQVQEHLAAEAGAA